MKEIDKFKEYLTENGAVLIPTTNEFELVRFKTDAGVSVLYRNKSGSISSGTNEAFEALTRFRRGKNFVSISRKRRHLREMKRLLAQRDGKECWFCGDKHELDELTIEHLLSFSHGGSDNPNNLVLACEPCNTQAGRMSIAKKVQLREQKRNKINVSIT